MYRRFVGLDGAARLPDETTILRFRHLLEKHKLAPQGLAIINAGLVQQGLMLKTGTVVDASIIAAPSSTGLLGELIDKAEHLNASVRAKVEHPIRVIKQQFGQAKTRYTGLAKNTARLMMVFALSNLWMARRQLSTAPEGVRL